MAFECNLADDIALVTKHVPAVTSVHKMGMNGGSAEPQSIMVSGFPPHVHGAVVVCLCFLLVFLCFARDRVFATCSRRNLEKDGEERVRLSSMFRDHAKSGNLVEMVQVFGEIDKRFPYSLDITEYHCLIVRLARAGDPITAHRWLQRAVALGLHPNPGMVKATMDAYRQMGAVDQAQHLASEMSFVMLHT